MLTAKSTITATSIFCNVCFFYNNYEFLKEEIEYNMNNSTNNPPLKYIALRINNNVMFVYTVNLNSSSHNIY